MNNDKEIKRRRVISDRRTRWLPPVAAVCLLTCAMTLGQGSDPYRGLWVGQVSLGRVSEVSVPLDEDNVAIAPDPEVATPTSDAAYLRLILHVNGAGRTSLLKDVAILARSSSTNGFLAAESDLALVTDETLYGAVPAQPAVRIASAVFDFGDSRATDALDAMRDAAAQGAADVVSAATDDAVDDGTAETDALAAALTAAQPVIDNADVAEAFDMFLRDEFDSLKIESIADDTNNAASYRGAATNLFDASLYSDSRAIDLIDDLVEAVSDAGTNAEERVAAAHAMASAYADVEDEYHRFIAGKIFGDMIFSCANAGYNAMTNSAATEVLIRSAVEAGAVNAFAEALQIKVARYDDSRGHDAVQVVVAAIADAAVASHSATGGVIIVIEDELLTIGHNALAGAVARYPVKGDVPTPDYNDFVTSDDYLSSAAVAADAAAEGAVFERENNPLWTEQSVADAALLAAANALGDLYEEAARAGRTSLPLDGVFAPGEGDTRLTWEIKQEGEEDLGAPGLTGLISLPARHPTNPFRHRRHPDHTAGLNIRRHLRLDFDGTPTNALERAGFGVDRITGVYREEVEGLHKPLGPGKNIGLKTEGTFELNRISLIDVLNAL